MPSGLFKLVLMCLCTVVCNCEHTPWGSSALHKQLGFCTTRITGDRQQGVINLKPLARKDGLPRYTTVFNFTNHAWNYSFNPCEDFDIPHDGSLQGYGDHCYSVSVCKYIKQSNQLHSYTMGIHADAKFNVWADSRGDVKVELIYSGIKSMQDRSFIILLVCDKKRVDADSGFFRVISDTGKGPVYSELHHECCCLGGCAYDDPDVTEGIQLEKPGSNLTGSDSQGGTDKEDGEKMLMVVGTLVAVLMLVALIGGLCYVKSTHQQLYSTLSVKRKGGALGISPGLKTDLRDYEPAAVIRKKNLPVLQDTMINRDALEMCQRLGGGIFGDTHLAKWHEMTVAVKRLTLLVHENQITPEAMKLMKNDVWFLSRQRHRNIVTVLGLCLDGKLPSIITEYVIGECLKDFIKVQGPLLSWPHRVRICLQVADGMAFLHSTKPPIIHRDLRCGNLFLSDDDVVKVADFGLIKLLQPVREECPQDDCCCRRTMSACPASIRWTAPELLAHPVTKEEVMPPVVDKKTKLEGAKGGKLAATRRVITPACDVYSFAMVMWELPMCLDPFDGITSESEVIDIIKNGGRPETPPSADMMPSYKELMKSCWDQIPDYRPGFKQIAAQLKDLGSQARSYQKQLQNRQRLRKLQETSTIPV
ncbi:uncharacterized protein LOC143301882 [Babylonia areolata]|uniref:uncharacterized protein LOC143301882 n=1 Tax=Babylonia areolata TaxID=304850 RepID=UPI003FD1AFB1